MTGFCSLKGILRLREMLRKGTLAPLRMTVVYSAEFTTALL